MSGVLCDISKLFNCHIFQKNSHHLHWTWSKADIIERRAKDEHELTKEFMADMDLYYFFKV